MSIETACDEPPASGSEGRLLLRRARSVDAGGRRSGAGIVRVVPVSGGALSASTKVGEESIARSGLVPDTAHTATGRDEAADECVIDLVWAACAAESPAESEGCTVSVRLVIRDVGTARRLVGPCVEWDGRNTAKTMTLITSSANSTMRFITTSITVVPRRGAMLLNNAMSCLRQCNQTDTRSSEAHTIRRRLRTNKVDNRSCVSQWHMKVPSHGFCQDLFGCRLRLKAGCHAQASARACLSPDDTSGAWCHAQAGCHAQALARTCLSPNDTPGRQTADVWRQHTVGPLGVVPRARPEPVFQPRHRPAPNRSTARAWRTRCTCSGLTT